MSTEPAAAIERKRLTASHTATMAQKSLAEAPVQDRYIPHTIHISIIL